VVAFTAAQIPGIEGRTYPPNLAGSLYPKGIPIFPEEHIKDVIREKKVDVAVFSYSDVSHQEVMEKASKAMVAGADFMLLSPRSTFLEARKPVIAVTASRTGAGKSTVTRYIMRVLREAGVKAVVIRHPMPYGVLERQTVQRFEKYEDLERHSCTIEEREEYEPHLEAGNIVYAGVDYARILEEAEREAEVLVWDGGNNDFPFLRPAVWIMVLDSHRPGHELTHYPSIVNLMNADIFIINKADTASPANIDSIKLAIRSYNPFAEVVMAGTKIVAEGLERLSGLRVVALEDGPSVTHGGMSWGIAYTSAEKAGAEIVDPKPFAVGSIAEAYQSYPHIGRVVPALGYTDSQVKDLEKTLSRVECDAIVSGTPTDITRIVKLDKPVYRVRYELDDFGQSILRNYLVKYGLIQRE
jgi:predicted GTPase